MKELIDCTAAELVEHIAHGRVSAVKVLEAHLARVDALNPILNAICTINPAAQQDAQACDARLARGAMARALEGVPVVIKDNIETGGLRTTFGSLLSQDFVPSDDALLVKRLRAAGAIIIGKTNTPEFAADINTTNKVFGQTRNPWDVNVTPGGSSGGTAAAIAARMAPIGIGTDLGGSIRIPASYNGIVGLRPSPGRVPIFPQLFGWDTLVPHVQGPLARCVGDLGLVLSVIAGPDDLDPSSLPTAATDYANCDADASELANARIAYAGDFAGLVPMDPLVRDMARRAAHSLSALGTQVVDDTFDASAIAAVQKGTRAFNIIARLGEHYPAHRDEMMPPSVNQIEAALGVDVQGVTEAERLRTVHWHRVREFMERYDFIATPTVGAPPFRLDEALPSQVGGRAIKHYYDTILTTYIFSVTGLPVVSVPCGFTDSGLPIGLQLVGKRHAEDKVLALAKAYQRLAGNVFVVPDAIAEQVVNPVSEALSMPGVPVGGAQG